MVSIHKNVKIKNVLDSVLFSLLSIFISIIIAVMFVMWSKGNGFIESFKLLITSFWKVVLVIFLVYQKL